jgi:hypothetical protein
MKIAVYGAEPRSQRSLGRFSTLVYGLKRSLALRRDATDFLSGNLTGFAGAQGPAVACDAIISRHIVYS